MNDMCILVDLVTVQRRNLVQFSQMCYDISILHLLVGFNFDSLTFTYLIKFLAIENIEKFSIYAILELIYLAW